MSGCGRRWVAVGDCGWGVVEGPWPVVSWMFSFSVSSSLVLGGSTSGVVFKDFCPSACRMSFGKKSTNFSNFFRQKLGKLVFIAATTDRLNTLVSRA